MRINGKAPAKQAPIRVVFPRNPEEDNIVFTIRPVPDRTEFTKQFKMPEPPLKTIRGGIKEKDFSSKLYKSQMEIYEKMYMGWVILKALDANSEASQRAENPEGVYFESIDATKSETWVNWESEMKEAGLNEGELTYLIMEIQKISGFNARYFDEARESFLTGVPQEVVS